MTSVEIDIHQLRHAHATELINAGASIEAVRRRLGHASTETTQLYTPLAADVADATGNPLTCGSLFRVTIWPGPGPAEASS
ncbi:tyrosine-type recombinase/integrase [Nonomuraea typhae]|uniref:Tyrosine-type recombinase/integrase n=1 Tax=Nonomuraea typhae TaxID=2603600 RepID=A0ABW7ZEL4_9ACTN